MKNLSIPELEKKRSEIQLITSLSAGALIVLFVVSIWSMVRTGKFDWTLLVAVGLSFMVYSSYKRVKIITTEIQSRN